MRHVPEDELHAYLDQALSRSQCIEIETHLARCAACRESRDDIAGLRDRTTAMLARVAPIRRPSPAFATLAAKAAAAPRPGWRRPALWAASFAGAVLAGWGMRAAFDPHQAPGEQALLVARAIEVPTPVASAMGLETESPTIALLPDPTPSLEPRTRGPSAGELEVRQAVRSSVAGPLRPAPAAAVAIVPAALSLDSRWLAVTLAEAEEATLGLVPLVPDLPVLDIRMRPGGAQERPLLVVTQRHPSGVLVHTVEGPVQDVAAVVSAQLTPESGFGSSEVQRSTPDYVEAGSGFARTHRVVVVVARLPADSLNHLAGSVVMR